jgi:hypothetical protein
MALANNPPNISFRRNLVGPKLIAWQNLIDRLTNVQLRDISDVFKWNLHQTGVFSVCSTYNVLINIDIILNSPYIWKIKIPLKIKIFLWFLYTGVILTKDNLARKKTGKETKSVFLI